MAGPNGINPERLKELQRQWARATQKYPALAQFGATPWDDKGELLPRVLDAYIKESDAAKQAAPTPVPAQAPTAAPTPRFAIGLAQAPVTPAPGRSEEEVLAAQQRQKDLALWRAQKPASKFSGIFGVQPEDAYDPLAPSPVPADLPFTQYVDPGLQKAIQEGTITQGAPPRLPTQQGPEDPRSLGELFTPITKGFEAFQERLLNPVMSFPIEKFPAKWEPPTPGGPYYPTEEQFVPTPDPASISKWESVFGPVKGRMKWTGDAYRTPGGGISPHSVAEAMFPFIAAPTRVMGELANVPVSPQDTVMAERVRQVAEEEEQRTGVPLTEYEKRKIKEDLYKTFPGFRGFLQELPLAALPPAARMIGGLKALRTGEGITKFGRAGVLPRGAIRTAELALSPLAGVEEAAAAGIAAPFQALGKVAREIPELYPRSQYLPPEYPFPVLPPTARDIGDVAPWAAGQPGVSPGAVGRDVIQEMGMAGRVGPAEQLPFELPTPSRQVGLEALPEAAIRSEGTGPWIKAFPAGPEARAAQAAREGVTTEPAFGDPVRRMMEAPEVGPPKPVSAEELVRQQMAAAEKAADMELMPWLRDPIPQAAPAPRLSPEAERIIDNLVEIRRANMQKRAPAMRRRLGTDEPSPVEPQDPFGHYPADASPGEINLWQITSGVHPQTMTRYNRGINELAREMGISEREARKLVDDYPGAGAQAELPWPEGVYQGGFQKPLIETPTPRVTGEVPVSLRERYPVAWQQHVEVNEAMGRDPLKSVFKNIELPPERHAERLAEIRATRAAGEVVPTARAAPAAGERFVADLRPLQDVSREVVDVKNPIIRAIAKYFVNPSAALQTPSGKILTAYYRQNVAIGELVETALTGGLDSHVMRQKILRRGLALPPVRINSKGFFGDTGHLWNDVFSRPDDPRWASKISPSERDYINDYLSIIDQTERMRLNAGLRSRGTRSKDGWFYVPRQVEKVGEITLDRPTNPNLVRVWEDATDGYAAGVRYLADPRATLSTHMKTAYKEILNKQLADALEPLSITPLRLMDAAVVIDYRMKVRAFQQAHRERIRIRVPRVTPGEGATPAEKALRRELTGQRRAAQAREDSARRDYNSAKEKYRRAREKAKKAEYASGELFGRAEGDIPISLWRNRFLPREDAEILNDALGLFRSVRGGEAFTRMGSKTARGFEMVADQVRFLSAIGDFAEPLTHGFPFMVRDPVGWARASLRHYQAFFDPAVQARFIRENMDTYLEMAQHGIPVGDPEVFKALLPGQGLSPGALLEGLPKGAEARRLLRAGGKQFFGRFQASYSTGLGMSRALLWKSLKPTWDGSLEELASYIRNMTGGLDSRALGVGPSQRGFESFFLAFSPRLLRSTVALVADGWRGLAKLRLQRDLRFTSEATRKQKESLHTVANFIVAVHMLGITAGLGLGKSWEEILDSITPTKGKRHLAHIINGDWVGVGGQMRALMQLHANTFVAIAKGDPSAFINPSVFDNPLLQFAASRGAVGLNIAGALVEGLTDINALPYDNIDSVPDVLSHIGTSALPFAAQGRIDGEGLTGTTFAVTGWRTSPLTGGEKKNRARIQSMKDKGWHGVPYNELAKEVGEISDNTEPVTEYAQLPQGLKNVVDKDEAVVESQAEVVETRGKFNPKQAEYTEKMEEINTQAAAQLEKDWEFSVEDDPERAGKYYRLNRSEALSKRYILRADRREAAEKQNLFDFPEKDRTTAEAVVDDYWALLTSVDDEDAFKKFFPDREFVPLEDPESGDFNFDERERRLAAFAERHGAGSVEAIEQKSLEWAPEPEINYKAARKYIESTGYWGQYKEVAAEWNLSSLWEEYKLKGTAAARKFKKENPRIEDIVIEAGKRKHKMRLKNTDLDKVLVYWGYVPNRARYTVKDVLLGN